MKNLLMLPVGLMLVSAGLIAQPAATPPPAANAPAAPRPARLPSPQGVDNFYKLGPDSLRMEGVPRGKFTEGKVIQSQVFPGTQHTYYVYVPAQYDPSKPTALMVFCDGQAMMAEPGSVQGHVVLDNLIYRGELPVMLGVFINPGRRPDQPEPSAAEWGDRTANRKEEYDTPNEKFARVLVEELMPDLKKDFNVSPDPEMHGVMGTSSGGIAAFGVVWFRPNDFRKAISMTGTFRNIRGGHVFPEFVAASEKKPIRVFFQDGRNDSRNPTEPTNDSFFQNVRLMRALTAKGYDVNYSWGINNHGQKQGGAIFPEMMRWLWRDHPISLDPTDMVERSLRAPFGASQK